MPKNPSGTPKPNGSRSRPRIKMPRINWRTRDLSMFDTGDKDSLYRELLTYQRNLDLLLERKGQYVIIKGDEIIGYYPDLESAMDAGAERFGTEPALIMKIVQFQTAISMGGVAF